VTDADVAGISGWTRMAVRFPAEWFDPSCVRCERLVGHLVGVRRAYPDYHAAPVPPFGARDASLLVVGLAPGMHGANASGRPFTGDFAGILLYETLYRFGFSSRPASRDRADGLELFRCRITNAVKCLPPANKPTTAEVKNCGRFLRAELRGSARSCVVLALGLVAHNAVLRAAGVKQSAYRFAHGAEHRLPDGRRLLDSYHCSRYNTQTGRLTRSMFEAVFARARTLVEEQKIG
jgi:uracil-DNA glycosylase family 4